MTSAGSVSNSASPTVAAVVPLLPAWRLDRAFDYLVPSEMEKVQVGSLVRVPFGNRKVRAVVVAIEHRDPDRDLQAISKTLLPEPVTPPPLDAFARWVATRYAVPLGKALDRFAPPRVRIAKLDVLPLEGGPEPELVPRYDNGRSLLSAIEDGGSGTWCLNALQTHDHGPLIAELVAAAGRAGGSALVAVPEVRFGSLVLDHLQGIWSHIARVDSSRPEKEQAEAWLRLARGHGLGGGGRSTVFAPAPRLRLIVIDEEHHRTFKEDRSPRYDARRAATERARLQGAVCVLLSHAPTVETAGAVARGEVGWVAPSRAQRRSARPLVETVEPGANDGISETAFGRIRDALRGNVEVAVLVPRRGYAPVVWCAACRRSLRCSRCEAAVVFDRVPPAQVRCPRCDLRSVPPTACPTCGADDFRFLGAGVERFSEQLAKTFPRARVRRMDPTALEAEGTAVGSTDIYVTTWIGTKPELRPDARLVVVLDADGLVRRPEPRAAEHGFHALADMARWAGPAASGGRLVIQTTEPGHPAVQAVVRGDPRYFLEREIEARRDPPYPPHVELVRVIGPPQAVREAARRAAELGAKALGPIPARDASEGQEEFLLKAGDVDVLMRGLRPLLAAQTGGPLRLDADPR